MTFAPAKHNAGRKLKYSARSVQYTRKRFSVTRSHVNSSKTGCKRITINRDDRKILRESLQNSGKISSEVAAELSKGINKTISVRTIRKWLQEAGVRGKKP
ncbi:hypothetical protein Trydic_g1181 [Trypoxylus dichotomus]